MIMMKFKVIFLFLIARTALCQTIVSSADFTKNVVKGSSVQKGNVAGISMNYPQAIPYWSNSLFIARQNTSMFDRSYTNIFTIILHVPLGYKYGCTTTVYGTTVTCTYDISTNTTLTTAMNKFFLGYGNYFKVDLGWDMEKANFSRTAYMTNFQNYYKLFSTSFVNIELMDFGDKYIISGRNYTAANFVSDVSTIYNSWYGAYANGPGITQTADSSWVSQMDTLYKNYFTTFTFRCIVFKNNSLATIDNLLHENYSRVYLRNRLVDANKKLIDFSKYPIAINDIRLTNDSGVNGVTNSFAAALWALDITVQFASLPGQSINFYNPLTPSNQSVFGAAPDFAPGAIYYGLLFASYALRNYPRVDRPVIVSGTSGGTKIFGLDSYDDYKILMINKDTNPNISGVVNINHSYAYGYRCYYLSAPTLNSTKNITWAGMYFEGGNPNYLGSLQYTDYKPSIGQVYSFQLAYAQAALCQQIPAPRNTTGREFPRGRSKNLEGGHLLYGLGLLVMIVILAQE